MKRVFLVILFTELVVSSFLFASQLASLSASPIYLLPEDTVTLSLSLSSTNDVKNVTLNLFYGGATYTLYNPTVRGKNYVWNYVTPHQPYDFVAQAVITFNSTSIKQLSNVATFSTHIPAASVESTVVYIPFITSATRTWKVKVQNIGSKLLKFTTSSSPQILKIFPVKGEIEPGKTSTVSITSDAFLLPGNVYILDAFLDTNDPRKNMSHHLLARILEGPDGLVISPISVSHSNVSVGSDVDFGFSIFHSGITLKSVYVVWELPKGTKTFFYSGNKERFSSSLRINYAGAYKLSDILITYVYKESEMQMVFHPNIKIMASNSSKNMDVNLKENEASIEISSSTTPTVHVKDGEIDEILNVTKGSPTTWYSTYVYRKVEGPVTVYATFDDVNYVVSKTFHRYILSPLMTNISFEGGWITVPRDTFSSTALVVLVSKTINYTSYYKGYENFTPVSNVIEVVSNFQAKNPLLYHINFDLSIVNGLFGSLKVYKNQDGKWVTDSATLSIQGNLASFNEKFGTYTIGISPDVQPNSQPMIKSFTIIPRRTYGEDVQFFLSVDKDCYYRLEIYDMRSRIVKIQTGEIMGGLGNLLYVLDPTTLPNGLYVAVVGVGSSPYSVIDSTSRSFVIVK